MNALVAAFAYIRLLFPFLSLKNEKILTIKIVENYGISIVNIIYID